MSSLLIRKDPYLIMCNMFHSQTFSLYHQWLVRAVAVRCITHWVNELPYNMLNFPSPWILWKRLSYLKVMVGPVHEACFEDHFFNAEGIIIEHIMPVFAAALCNSYLPLGKILRSQCLEFKY